MAQVQELTQKDILRRYPRTVAHLICESLGYFTPAGAALAILDHKRGIAHYCEWYTHMARSWSAGKVREVGRTALGRAFRLRRTHHGFMADYGVARRLVDAELKGHGPEFASWF